MSLYNALGGLRSIAQWFVWRLEWNQADGKYDKTPCAADGSVYKIDAGNRENWMSYADAVTTVERLQMAYAGGAVTYTLGFWMTKGCGYWFLDLDHALQDGQWLPFALQLCQQTYPGALVEVTSSGKGLHIIGRGDAPPHRNKPEKSVKDALAPLELEFYTDGRGIAFGLTGEATGSADVVFDVAPLCAAYFPYREISELSIVRRPEWRGPEDDDALIDRALNARKSAAVMFGTKVGFEQLWRGEVEHNNENDMALASHLAFWAGADSERVERLMVKSGMVRDKWFERRRDDTYLGMTVKNACASCENVYQEPIKSIAVQTEMYGTPDIGATITHVGDGAEFVSPERYAKVMELIDIVAGCENELQMHNEIIPQIRAANVPGAFKDKIAGAVNAALKFWKANLPIKELRALLFPPSLMEAPGIEGLPDWARHYCYVLSNDRFFNLHNGTELSMVGFQAAFGRNMPITEAGRRENPAEKCLHFWNMPIAELVGYMPGAESIYQWQGATYANLYSPASLPEVAGAYTAEGVAAIAQFQQHMFDMCGRREDVFYRLLYWFAHNVQQPGRKIRWSPIIKGVHGDGKTLLSYVLRAAMGYRNVSTTSNATLSNKGGFTDWAVRGAVNIIEEIMLTGKERHTLYNATKEFISNNVVDVNPKGAKSYTTHNNTNHYATTNHNDAIPLESTDRRWFVIFTPWSSLDEMMRYCGISALQWKERTDAMDRAIKDHAGELRAWFLGVEIPAWFDVDGSAMMTPEKRKMMSSSKDTAETIAADIITTGAVGVAENVLSSSMLSALMENRAQFDNFEVPRSTSLNHMLTRLGYSKMEKLVKWNGRSHSIWVRDGVDMDNDQVRLELDRTALVGPALGTQGSAVGLVAPTPPSA